MTDSDPDVRWMTYAEAAAALGVNPESVAKRMRRGGWGKRLGNDGKPRVAVPVSVLPNVPVFVPDGASDVPDHVPDTTQSVPDKALADVVAVFREERDQLRSERDAAQAAAVAERSRADRTEGEAVALREAVAREAAARQAAEARAARDGARADQEAAARRATEIELAGWAAGGPLARAWRAFRRGRP